VVFQSGQRRPLFIPSTNLPTFTTAAYGPSSDLLDLVTGGDAQSVKAAIERFQHSFGCDASANAAGRAVLDVNGCPYRDLIVSTMRVQRMERSRLHQADHVRGRVNRRQLRMMGRERVLEVDGFLRLTARADGNLCGQDGPPKAK
jgi:hypothetical protein